VLNNLFQISVMDVTSSTNSIGNKVGITFARKYCISNTQKIFLLVRINMFIVLVELYIRETGISSPILSSKSFP
jgi:hypothetical protein